MGMTFWDAFKPKVEEVKEKPDPVGMNRLVGECADCGELSIDIMFGYCPKCGYSGMHNEAVYIDSGS